MYFLEKLNYINSFFCKSHTWLQIFYFHWIFAPWKRIMGAEKYYLDLFKKLLIKNIKYVTAFVNK